MNVQSDEELVKETLAGEEQAFASLVMRYERPVRAAALHVLKDRHLACDVAQEVFLRAYRQLGSLQQPGAFGAWVLRIAHRCALDAQARRRSEQSLRSYERDATGIASHNGQLDEDKQSLLTAVMGLPAGEREVILLRYFGGHTVREVASIAGRSVGTVTKQLSRAHRRLRKTIEES
jgi:RNA polymerase sigma-70 factor (ECF subfamily)